MKVTIACLLVALVTVAARPKETPQTFCGRALAEARILYCYGPEIEEQMKRDYDNNMLQSTASMNIWPWLYSRYSKANSKRQPGLIDECCLKPCYISQLLSYC